MKVNKFAFGCC